MNYSINSAFERIQWQLFKNKGVPNKTDIAAMKFIAEWINAQQTQTIASHQMFAKMYVERFNIEFSRFGDLHLALAATKSIQNLPFEFYVDKFAMNFNVAKYRMYCESKNIIWDVPEDMSDEDKELIKWQWENDKGYQKHVLGFWKTEKVRESIVNDITDLVNKYKNGY